MEPLPHVMESCVSYPLISEFPLRIRLHDYKTRKDITKLHVNDHLRQLKENNEAAFSAILRHMVTVIIPCI